MIQLTCANCKSSLEVDDAFAGGVCRCQYCGTIQTVPRPNARPRVPGAVVANAASAASSEPKALYQVKSRTGLSSAPSGLEELAEVVHSSGLSGSGLLNRPTRTAGYQTPQAQARRLPVIPLIAGGVVALLVLTLALLWFLSGSPPDQGVASGSASKVPTTPQFAGIDLSGDRIVYVVDRGDATASYFKDLKPAIVNSVTSLGTERRFAVMLWNNGAEDFFPRTGTTYATADEAKSLAAWLDDVSIGRASSAESALKAAIAQDASEILLITAKAYQLEGFGFENEVVRIKGDKSVKIHGITLGDSPPGDPLRKIALETGGQFKQLSRSDLADLAR